MRITTLAEARALVGRTYRSRDPEYGTLEKFCLVNEDRHRNGEGRRGIVHKTFRECIDEAMGEAT